MPSNASQPTYITTVASFSCRRLRISSLLTHMTDYQRGFLKDCGVAVPISVVPYPCDTAVAPFGLDAFLTKAPRRLVMIGDYLRRYESLFDLAAAGYERLLLRPADRERPGTSITDLGSTIPSAPGLPIIRPGFRWRVARRCRPFRPRQKRREIPV